MYDTLLKKQKYIVTHTICQVEIPALLDSKNTSSVKMLCPQETVSPCIFVKT